MGWNSIYDFNDFDLATSLQMVTEHLKDRSEIPWELLANETA